MKNDIPHSLKLKWLGTAGFHIMYKNQEILLDPFLSRPKGATPFFSFDLRDYSKVSAILVSHGHFDHSMDIARLAQVSDADIYAPLKCLKNLKKNGIDTNRFHPNESTQLIKLNDILIQILPSKHIIFDIKIIIKTLVNIYKGGIFFDLFSLIANYPLGSNSDFLMSFDGYKILFSGSGGGHWKDYAKLKPDCLMLPFAGRTDILQFYLKVLKIIHPKKVIIHHFDNFFPFFSIKYPVEEFKKSVSDFFPDISLMVPDSKNSMTIDIYPC